uniref:Polyprotein n=1 Tax=Schistosoma mansoni TaxID=6183 RepID=Q4QQD8_SCHMA|nr:TPA: polyprotein [Schistosoma mansoni]
MPVSTGAETDITSSLPIPASSIVSPNYTLPDSSSTCLICFAIFPTHNILLSHATAIHHISCPPTPVQDGSQQMSCVLCAAAFSSNRGLTQHIRHRHISEYNELIRQRIAVQPTSRIWSPFDDASLLSIANHEAHRFPTKNDLCQHISTILTRRTAEAVKRRLLHLQWSRSPTAITTSSNNHTITDIPNTEARYIFPVDLDEHPPLSDATTPNASTHPLPELLVILTPLPSPTRLQNISESQTSHESNKNSMHTPPTYACDPDETLGATPSSTIPSCFHSYQDPLAEQRGKLLRASASLLQSSCTRIRSSSLLAFLQNESTLMDEEHVSTFLNSHAEFVFPRTWTPSRPKHPSHAPANVSRKKRRKIEYAHIQRLFHHRPKDASNTVLDGRWRNPYVANHSMIPDFDCFWTTVFTKTNSPDSREITPIIPMTPSLIDPILPSDVTWALKEMHGTAGGIDRLTSYDLMRFGKNGLAGYLNMLLALAYLPTNLSTARVTFVPKSSSPVSPEDFRPISVAPVATRCLHKILAKRWMPLFPQERLQFAFLNRDGCFEAVNLLHSVIRHVHTRHTGASFALLDISRAFDTVSHDSIIRAAKRYGAPELLCRYLNNYYRRSTSCVNRTELHPTCGVKQGDPLSPLLFIMVLDEVLEGLDPMTHLTVDGESLNYIAYADDLVVFAPNAELLQRKLDRISILLHEAGWSVNPEKSRTLDLISGGHSKITALSQTEFTIAGMRIPPLSAADTFDYLGIKFNFKGRCPVAHIDLLNNYLTEISCAPLKPQQRMKILKDNLLPRLLYPLTLGIVHLKTLKSMDRNIHTAIRKWLRLPSDTPLAYFHSPVAAGGLGILHLSSSVPFHRRKRLETLLSSPNRLLHKLPTSPTLASYSHLSQLPVRIGHETVTSREEASNSWVRRLHSSCDGKGLLLAPLSTESHAWLRYPQSIFPSVYINAVKLRGGLLSTKVRRSRGGRVTNGLNCRGGCAHHETIHHILQHCALTHDIRCKRHNELCNLVAKKLRRQKIHFLQEPCIPLEKTYCKPDFIIIRDSIAYVLDVTVSDDGNTHASRLLKISKYGNERTVASIKRFLTSSGYIITSVRQTPVVLTFRGILDRASSQSLRRLCFSSRDLGDLCLSAIQGSIKIYNTYMRGT